VLPTAEKALLRSPECSLDVVADFFSAYSQPFDTESFKRVLSQAINSAKSSNPSTRAGSIKLFKSIISIPTVDSSLLSITVTELLALPKANKTAGPDHRVALYTMLASLPPSSEVSSSICQGIAPLLAKEPHEGAMSVLAAALPVHVGFLLNNNIALSSDFATLVAKEMASLKPPVRRAFCSLAGGAIWSAAAADGEITETALAFTKAVLPALENSLKNVSSNPLNSSAGPLEAYIAVAVMLGPLSRSGKFGAVS